MDKLMFFFILAINLNFNFHITTTLCKHYHNLRNDAKIVQY
jgi:hypothetical protein